MQCLNGLTEAMFLFLIASGLSLIFGVLGVLNFAHGSLYMLGAYLTYSVASLFLGSPASFWIAVVAASGAVALIGGVVEWVFLRPVYRREELDQLLLTYALVLVISDLVKIVWGSDNLSVNRPAMLDGSVDIAGHAFPTYNVFVLVLGPLVALGLWLLLRRTQFGRLIRAAANDREMVGVVGVNVAWLFTAVFVLGAWLGGLGGGLAAPVAALYPGMDVEVIVESFIVVVVGGLGSFGGTLVGSLVIGQLNAFGILFFPRFAIVFVYILMAVVLVTRPWGLLGKPIAS